MLNKFWKFKDFIGNEVFRYLLVSGFLGLLWFGIESSFIFILQSFLYSIGLLTKQQTFLPDWYPTSLTASILILIAFGLCRALVYMFKTHFSTLTQTTFNCQQRAKILSYSLENTSSVSIKEVVSVFTEVASQAGVFMNYIATFSSTAISAAFFFLMGFKLAPYEMLIGVGLLGAFLLPLKLITRKINKYGVGLIDEWEKVSASLLWGIRNGFFLSIYRQVNAEIAKGNGGLMKYKTHFISYSLLASFSLAFPMFLGIAILSFITSMSIRYIHTDPMQLVSFFYVFMRLAQAASELSGTISNMKFNLPGIKTLYAWNVKFEESQKRKNLNPLQINDRKVDIEAQGISFNYSETKPLLTDINFAISQGDVLVIKGESGVGKSTLLSIILGLQKPTKGSLVINGSSSGSNDFDLHQILAYVGPEPYLIQGTLRENLTYGLTGSAIHEEKIWEALELLELKDLVQNLTLKLDEPLHDIPQLSTGQKQRLSFARALIRQPSLLILDEATANLDAATERKIIQNLKHLLQKCTCIIVTHKDSFDSIATRQLHLIGR